MPKRIYFLDSLRGIAAVTVIATHFAETFQEESLAKEIFQPLGRSAVIFFFLLSGIALSLALKNKSNFSWQEYGAFLVKRFCRIYLPFLAVIILAECLFLGFEPTGIAGLSSWFNAEGTTLQWHVFFENIFMVGNDVDRIDPVIWSLIVELRISIVFPLFYYFIKNKGIKWAAGFVILAFGLGTVVLFAIDQQFMLGQTIFHLGFFIIGIVLALHWDAVWAFSRNQKIAVTAFSMVLYLHVIVLHLVGINLPQVFSDVVISIGCVGILLVCFQSKKAQNFLVQPIYLFLGKISFSIYLVHCVVFIPWIYLLYDTIPSIFVIELLSLPLIFAAAYLSYVLIEKSALQLGRKLEKTINHFHLNLADTGKERMNG
ncbi:acyltransferase [Listeria floridensis FSL S10-1187]|uniref:Acyltransferase n=1 Tax=Listeria floridensis FSL S10-1187 TaxID=1265817 RepID=A0ABP3B2L4_9LIST|nr:acyltransferase [Listeria floridensis]EUJ33808.1 acyltransferase [Listeria floridensis FSL S10-1187]